MDSDTENQKTFWLLRELCAMLRILKYIFTGKWLIKLNSIESKSTRFPRTIALMSPHIEGMCDIGNKYRHNFTGC